MKPDIELHHHRLITVQNYGMPIVEILEHVYLYLYFNAISFD